MDYNFSLLFTLYNMVHLSACVLKIKYRSSGVRLHFYLSLEEV